MRVSTATRPGPAHVPATARFGPWGKALRRSGAAYLRPYMPVHRGLRLDSLVGSVDSYLAAMDGADWPELTMPKIAQS